MGWVCPQHFLAIKIRKLAKIWCTLAYIVVVCWGNCTKHFHVMVPHKGVKISASSLVVVVGSFPVKFWSRKTVFKKFRDFARLYYKHLKIYRKSENGVANCNVFLAPRPNLAYFGLQTEKNRTAVLTHPRSIIVAIISPAFRRWTPLISQRLQNVYCLLMHHHPDKDISQKITNPRTSVFWRDFWQLC